MILAMRLRRAFRASPKNNRSIRKTTTPPGWVALSAKRWENRHRRSLFELDFADLDPLLVVFLGDNALDRPFLGFRANRLVVLLAAHIIEPVDGILDLDDGVALALDELQVALGAGDRALQGFFLLVFGPGQHQEAQDHSQAQTYLDSCL